MSYEPHLSLGMDVKALKEQVQRDTVRLLNLSTTCKRLREQLVEKVEENERLSEQLAAQIDENDMLRGINTFWGGKTECQRERDLLLLEVAELRKQVEGQVSFVSTEAADELNNTNIDLKRQLNQARAALRCAGWTYDQINRLLNDKTVI